MTTSASREARNVDLFQEEFRRNSDAAIGVFIIRTREVGRCTSAVQDISLTKDDCYYRVWVCNKGWQNYPRPSSFQDASLVDVTKPTGTVEGTIDIGKAFDSICKEAHDGIYVMVHPHHHFEKPLIHQYIKDFVLKAREFDQRLVLIVPDTVKIPIEIEDDLHVMDFRPPSHAELLDCYKQVFEGIDPGSRPDFDDAQIGTIIQNAVGMTWLEFETALSLGIVEMQNLLDGREDKEQHPEDYIKVILKHKTEAIKKTDLLELMDPQPMSDVGGLDLLKGWLEKRAKAYSEEARKYGIEVPKGVLCVGPPGAGKSLFAKAVSSTLLVPLVKFDIGKVFGKFIGESEGRMRQALQMIESLAPCVLLLDEIDKGFGGMSNGGGDGGIGQRVFGQFLTWMQERNNDRYPVFVVMTANNVTGLPPELMRKGRLDEIFAVTFPSEEERIEIIKIHLRKRGHEISDTEIAKVASCTDKFVGAELESIVKDGLLEAYSRKMKAPNGAVIAAQAENMQPLYKAFADRVNAMHEWAKNNAKPASSGMRFEGVSQPKVTGEGLSRPAPGGRMIRRPSLGPKKGGSNLDV
ncbi:MULTISPECIES: AAA family ATPase [unclassified Bradyrhizobium]|uniref:AAA family ATPase n=1 Tax=unclassified Bradyrhizobium TaxID=2631580 RepID=UPI0033997E6F